MAITGAYQGYRLNPSATGGGEDRAVPGHWRVISCPGRNNSYIATLVERHTRYVMLAKVAGKDTQTVVRRAHQTGEEATKELYKSLTWDRARNLRIIKRVLGKLGLVGLRSRSAHIPP